MNIYKNFFIKTLLLMIVVPFLIILVALLIGDHVIGKKNMVFDESYMINSWITQKENAANKLNKNGSKIVFVAGSNTLYGVNTKKIGDATGIPTLNLGTHAGLSAYIFYEAKKVLKPKDIVFLPLEYEYYTDEYQINSLPLTLVEYVISYDNNYYKLLSLKNKLRILTYTAQLKAIISIGKKHDRQYPLSSTGDVVEVLETDKNFAATAVPLEINVSKLSSNYQKWELYKFIQWCKRNDVKVFAFAPNFHHKQCVTEKEKSSLIEIYKFYKLVGVDFVGTFEDGFYNLHDMYNTPYHLNKKGQEKRTIYFIKKIKKLKLKANFL